MSKQVKQASNSVSVRPLIGVDFDHLIAVIDSTARLQETASDACIIELRRKLETMELGAGQFTELVSNVKAWQQYEKDSREYNVERMAAFGKYMSSPEVAMHVAALNFTETTKGESRCECQAFNVVDESTASGPRYGARFSAMFHNVTTAFHAAVKDNVETAFKALYSDNAAAELRRIYESIREADNAGKSKGAEQASGEDAEVALPENAPDWLQEAFNAASNLRRHFHAAYMADPEAAEMIIPTITGQVNDLVRDVQEAIRNALAVEAADKALDALGEAIN